LLEKKPKIEDNSAQRAVTHPHPMPMTSVCKHPKVRVVSRHDDVEFVECLECGEVFDSEEFRDMQIEENAPAEDDEDAGKA
jgi:Zn ribbon nucleic-acid-binding protein